MKKISREHKIDIRLSTKDRDLILEHTFIEQDYYEILESADLQSGYLTVGLTLEDLDIILGHIAASANHSDDSKPQQSLQDLYDYLAGIESRYAIFED